MNKIPSLVLVAVGAFLLVYGVSAADSIGSGFSGLFTGSPTEKSLWLLAAGVAVILIGVGSLFRGAPSR